MSIRTRSILKKGGDETLIGIDLVNDTGSNIMTSFDSDSQYQWVIYMTTKNEKHIWNVMTASEDQEQFATIWIEVRLVGEDFIPWSEWIVERAIIRYRWWTFIFVRVRHKKISVLWYRARKWNVINGYDEMKFFLLVYTKYIPNWAGDGTHLYVVLATNLRAFIIDEVVRAERFPSPSTRRRESTCYTQETSKLRATYTND